MSITLKDTDGSADLCAQGSPLIALAFSLSKGLGADDAKVLLPAVTSTSFPSRCNQIPQPP